MPEQLTIGVGVAAAAGQQVLDLGPVHPAGMGGWQLDVVMRDGVVIAADPRIGFTHRSDEKVLEARDYRQGLLLAGRHDWFASLSSELCFALAVEEGLGIVPSEHTTWSRTLLAEVVRSQALLLLAGGALTADDMADPAAGIALTSPQGAAGSRPAEPAFAGLSRVALTHRERLLALIERASGERVHPMITRIGGIAAPLDMAWRTDLATALTALHADLPAIDDAVRAYAAPFAGIGVLAHQQAVDLGASGPVGRASGIGLDVRQAQPYLAYADLADLFTPPATSTGDIPARYDVLLHDLAVAVALIEHAIDEVAAHADEPIAVSLPKTIRVPEGTTIASVEGPVGLTSVLLDSRGDRSPWRVKLRTPSFAHVQAMAAAAVGASLDQLPAVVMSFMFAIGDADR